LRVPEPRKRREVFLDRFARNGKLTADTWLPSDTLLSHEYFVVSTS